MMNFPPVKTRFAKLSIDQQVDGCAAGAAAHVNELQVLPRPTPAHPRGAVVGRAERLSARQIMQCVACDDPSAEDPDFMDGQLVKTYGHTLVGCCAGRTWPRGPGGSLEPPGPL